MSNLLKKKQALALLRVQLEKKCKKEYQGYKKFGHLAHNYKNKKEKEKRERPQNRFEILASSMIQSGKERGSIKQQEIEKEEEKVRCFRCQGIDIVTWQNS